MKKVKVFFGKMTLRFILLFIGTLIFSMIISGIYLNITHFSNIKDMTNDIFISRANQLKSLIENENMSVEKATSYLENEEASETVYYSFDETGITLTSSEKKSLENGDVISKINFKEGIDFSAVLKIDAAYVVISLDMENNPFMLFLYMQKIMFMLPTILGTCLILLAIIAITKPLRRISDASKKVARGDFSVEIPVKGHSEVDELTRNFNRMVKELSANEYLHKDFVSNVSHEFKTPITSLKGYAYLLKDENITKEKYIEYANIIISESERLSNLSSNLLKLSEIESDTFNLKKDTFRLDEQIRNAVLLLQNGWEEKEIEFNLDLENVNFIGDQNLTYQIWINLISNSIKYSNQKGIISLSLKRTDKIVFELSDCGIGIDKDDLEKIFTRFYKADKSRNTTGTGLGLSIVKRIVELHGGCIKVESELGGGSKFVIEF